jgi:hypothetical protein
MKGHHYRGNGMKTQNLADEVAKAESAYHALVLQPFDQLSGDGLVAHCRELDAAERTYNDLQDRLRRTLAVRGTVAALRADGGFVRGKEYGV